jgi:hypothetical protein
VRALERERYRRNIPGLLVCLFDSVIDCVGGDGPCVRAHVCMCVRAYVFKCTSSVLCVCVCVCVCVRAYMCETGGPFPPYVCAREYPSLLSLTYRHAFVHASEASHRKSGKHTRTLTHRHSVRSTTPQVTSYPNPSSDIMPQPVK